MLNRTVSVNVSRKPVGAVLDDIGRQGNFHFSYIRDFIRDDSLVTLRATGKTVKQVLDMLFQGSCQYREMGDQLILQRAGREKWYVVSGYITDAITGRPVSNASVYERRQLISTLTNDQGFFRLRLHERDQPAVAFLTVSKDLYKDTALTINSGYDQEMRASIKPSVPIQLSIVDVNQYSHVEQTWMGRFFLSSRQRIQSINLRDFFTNQPYQYSLVPGLGTHGKMASQVVNKVSLNLVGGYSAGLNGVELAGIFNIDQKDVRYMQAAGVFNIVGGKMTGTQLAGIHNRVLDSLTGVQAAGLSNVIKGDLTGTQLAGIYNRTGHNSRGTQAAGITNILKGNLKGAQLAGIYNHGGDSARGLQVAGIVNHLSGSIYGAQIAGIGNIDHGVTRGAQVSALFNYTKKLEGVQAGLVNISDSSSGYSIGFINIVKKGFHQVTVYNSELLHLNIAYRSGNSKLYSILQGGMSVNGNEKAYSFGYGIGHAFPLPRHNYITTEFVTQYLYLGSWKDGNTLSRLQAAFNLQLSRNLSLFGGPAFNIYYGRPENNIHGYKSVLPGPYRGSKWGDNVCGWLGWHVGIGFF